MTASQSVNLASSGTSRSLISGLRRQDAAAWERLVRWYSPLVLHWLRRWNLPSRDAADVLQDVYRSVARSVVGFRKERPEDTFRGWLRSIALNKVRDHYRRTEFDPKAVGGTDALLQLQEHPADDPSGDEHTPAWNSVLRQALEAVQTEFEPTTWLAFWKTVVEGRTAGEAAGELNLSPGAVRVAKCRILQRLREVLGDTVE